jgi:hypothetical protein
MLTHLQRIRRPRMKCQQRSVEVTEFVSLRDRFDIVSVNDGTAAGDDLRGIVVADESDEFDWHFSILFSSAV